MHEHHHTFAPRIATSCSLPIAGVHATLLLLASGGTVPFIARYRKEATGNMSEEQIELVRDELQRLEALEQRREAIIGALRQQGIQDPALFRALEAASTRVELEDLYVPYRRQRVTRADKARASGYGPLATEILTHGDADPYRLAAQHTDPAAAIAGAGDIIAEQLHQHAPLRRELRRLFRQKSSVSSTIKRAAPPEVAQTYRDYHDWAEPARGIASHRLMAILRGSQHGVLTVHVRPLEEEALTVVYEHGVAALEQRTAPPTPGRRRFIETVATDAYRRLLAPSLETEYLGELRENAHREAAEIFAQNLRSLLEAPPMGEVPVLAVDPGFRGGCKWVALGPQGQVWEHGVIYPLPPQEQTVAAQTVIRDVIARRGLSVVALGDGTGSREAEAFLRTEISIPLVLVREAGASVYSASPLARKEFPHLDVTIRGAISIGRRLMDPLAELVKIDPAAIGVGQYQHDIDPQLLQHKLTTTLQSCVNSRGVQVNTASRELLQHVAGLSLRTAGAIVTYRESHGPFRQREELQKVPGIGVVTYQQAVGFLRISGGTQPLDATGIHPEQYAVAEKLLSSKDQPFSGCSEGDLKHHITEDLGLPTLQDICRELVMMGQPAPPAPQPVTFDPQVHTLDDLAEGMTLPGRVTNITGFGAFIDIGVHRDGLVHTSRLSRNVRIYETVRVIVLEVDRQRGRISLDLTAG